MSPKQFRNKPLIVQDFSYQDLVCADFDGAYLMACDFRGANLSNADFRIRSARSCDFSHVTFDGVNFGEDEKTIGDRTCAHNARSPHLRCALNPMGPCEGCEDFERDETRAEDATMNDGLAARLQY